jgi:hypothetical protein
MPRGLVNSSYSPLEKMTRVIFMICDLSFAISDLRLPVPLCASLCLSPASRDELFRLFHTSPALGPDAMTPEITPRGGVIPSGARNLALRPVFFPLHLDAVRRLVTLVS